MRHTPMVLAAVAGAVLAWLAFDLLRPPISVPDTSGPLVAEVRRAEQARQAAQQQLDSVVAVLTDSTEAWTAERIRLARVTDQARRDAYHIAEDLRAALDTAGVRMLDELQAAHAVEIDALEQAIATHEAEVTALRAGLRTAELVIRAQADEIHAWKALDAERQDIEAALRGEIRKKQRTHRLTLAVASVGLALAAFN